MLCHCRVWEYTVGRPPFYAVTSLPHPVPGNQYHTVSKLAWTILSLFAWMMRWPSPRTTLMSSLKYCYKLGLNGPGLLAKTRATVDTESLACSQGLGAWPNSCVALEGHPAVLSLWPSWKEVRNKWSVWGVRWSSDFSCRTFNEKLDLGVAVGRTNELIMLMIRFKLLWVYPGHKKPKSHLDYDIKDKFPTVLEVEQTLYH